MTKEIYYKIEVQDGGRWMAISPSEYTDEQSARVRVVELRQTYQDAYPFRLMKYTVTAEEVKE